MVTICSRSTFFFWAVATCTMSTVVALRRLPSAQRSVADEVLSSVLLFDGIHDGSSSGSSRNSSSHYHSNVHRHHHRTLANVDVPLPTSPDDHLVRSLPLMSEGAFPTQHWAGLLPASDDGDKYLFYWLFAPDTSQGGEKADSDIPLIVWLNGGPGCSSMDGLFLENGPLRFEEKEGTGNFQLVPAEHSWHKVPAYTLYIDQPVGTGLSFTTSKKYPRNDLEVNVDFYHFLQSFFSVHSDKFVGDNQRVNRGFYFSGESHAGHYIPSIMAYILDRNEQIQQVTDSAAATENKSEAAASSGIYIPQSGAAIGNGWMDPFHQYAAAEAAYGHGIIGRAQMAALAVQEKLCQEMLNQKRYSSAVCFNLLDDIVAQSYGSKSNFKVSQYDIRQVESRRGSRTFPPGHKTVETYLGGTGSAAGMSSATMQEALEAIHATPSRQAGQVYQECTNPPYDALSHQDGLGVVNEVIKVLEHEGDDGNIRLLFFNGVTDLICNHVGNEILLEKLNWKHRDDWVKASRAAWKSKSQPGDNINGYIKEFNNLLYLKVMDSGHMVPMDVPEVAIDMIRLFVYGGEGAFQYSPQHLDRAAEGGQCPSCPTCPTNVTNYAIDSLESTTTSKAGYDGEAFSKNQQMQIVGGVVLGVVCLIGAFLWYRRNRYKNRSPVATYDLEMRGGTYFDDPDDGRER